MPATAPADAATATTTTALPVEQLHPNDWNANRMTDDEFAELVAEVKHLGRLPKPIIVRRNEDAYAIVDGEHNWRAAQKAGLAEVPCEIIEADDFEAMRQTYKRNQHGTHNPVLLGRMFLRMLDAGGTSRRALAKNIDVSEGTVRNAIEHVKAVEARNRYAQADRPKDTSAEDEIGKLSLRQVRCFNRLPAGIGNAWLNGGAEHWALYAVMGAGSKSAAREYQKRYGVERLIDEYRQLEEAGLTECMPPARSTTGFLEAIKKLREWGTWERRWARQGITQSEVREYAKLYYRRYVWNGWSQQALDEMLPILIDRTGAARSFVLTPGEVEDIFNEVNGEGGSHNTFMDRLCLAVAQKTGELPTKKYAACREMMEAEIRAHAPDYIRNSPLPLEEKHALWRAQMPGMYEVPEEQRAAIWDKAKRELAQRTWLTKRSWLGSWRQPIEEGLNACLHYAIERLKYKAQAEVMDEVALSTAIAERFHPKDPDAATAMASTLAALTKAELLVLNKWTDGRCFLDALAQAGKGMAAEPDDGTRPDD